MSVRYRALTTASTPINVAPILDWFDVNPQTEEGRRLASGLGVALVHASYLHEHPGELPDATGDTLRVLEALGVTWLRREATLRMYDREEFAAVGALSSRVAAGPKAAADWFRSQEWLQNGARLGRSEALDGYPRVAPQIGFQVVGLLTALDLLGVAARAFGTLLDSLAADVGRHPDPRTALNSHVAEKDQRWTVTGAGPDHSRTFTAELRVGSRPVTIGRGPSRRAATSDASYQYLASCHPASLQPTPTRRPSAPGRLSVPRSTDSAVSTLLHDFRLANQAGPLLTQALLHPSWVHEHSQEVRAARQRDNTILAFIGSTVLGHEYMRAAGATVLAGEGEVIGTAMTPTDQHHAEALRRLALSSAIALGRGQAQSPVTREIAAGAFQALCAALYIARGCPPRLFDGAPPSWSGAVAIATPARFRSSDAATLLQQRLVPTGIDVTYEVLAEGAAHLRGHTATMCLRHTEAKSTTTLHGPAASAKREAKIAVAEHAIMLIDSLYYPDDSVVSVDPNAADLLALLLHAATSAPGTGAKWARAELLGSHLLADPEGLTRWAARADDLLARTNLAHDVDGDALTEFYRAATAARPTGTVSTQRELHSVLNWVETATERDLTSDAIEQLAALCGWFRATSEQDDDEDLAQAVASWQTLRYAQFEGTIPKVPLTSGERAGLDYVVRRIGVPGTAAASADDTAGQLVFETALEVPNLERIARLFSEASPRIKMDANGSRLTITFFFPRPGSPSVLVSAACARAMRPLPNLFNSAIADKLHDAKNQLVAARAASSVSVTDRTSALEARLASSKHLDSAATIARQVLAASSLLTSMPTGETAVVDFLRRYTAGLLTRLPTTQIVIGPTCKSNPLVAVDRSTLTAVLDNLVTNALEAMPGGGTLRLDCLDDDEVAVVVVEDTGPGLPTEVAQALSSGMAIRSSKALGNGLGLRGVQVLLDHVGGRLELLEGSTGTCWWIVLPKASQAAGTEPE